MARFGKETLGPYHTTTLMQYQWANFWTVPEGYIPNSITFHVKNDYLPGCTAHAALYEYIADDQPGALLAETETLTIAAGFEGWVTAQIVSPPTLPAGPVFIVIHGLDADGQATIEDRALFTFSYSWGGGATVGVYAWRGDPNFGNSFGGAVHPLEEIASAYCDYTPVAGPPPDLVGSMFFTPAELTVLQGLTTAPTHAVSWNQIVAWATAHINDAAPGGPTFGSGEGAKNYIIAMGLMYHVTGDDAYAEAGRRWLNKMVTWPQWDEPNNPSWQIKPWCVQAGAIGYNMFEDYLPPAELSALAAKIFEATDASQTRGLAGFIYPEEPTNIVYPNFLAVMAGSVGLAALALENVYDTSSWFQEVDQATQVVLDGMGVDGGWHEGQMYGCYSLNSLMWYIDALRRVKGTDFFSDKLNQWAGKYLVYMNYNDGALQLEDYNWVESIRLNWIGEIYLLARDFNNPHAQWFAETFVPALTTTTPLNHVDVRPFLWRSSTLVAQPPSTLPVNAWFTGLGYVFWRKGWGDTDLLFAFKSGTSQGHAHPDQNSYQIYNDGNMVVTGEGYTFHEHTENSTSMLVNGQPQGQETGDDSNMPLGTRGIVQQVDITPHYRYLLGDAAAVYAPTSPIIRWNRHVVMLEGPDVFVFYDDVAAATAKTFTFLHLNSMGMTADRVGWWNTRPTLTINGNTATLNNHGSILHAAVLSPATLAKRQYDTEDGRYVQLQVTPPAASQAKVVTVIMPQLQDVAAVDIGNCIGAMITHATFKDMVLFSKDGGAVNELVELGDLYQAADGGSYSFEGTAVRAQFNGYQVMRLEMAPEPPPPGEYNLIITKVGLGTLNPPVGTYPITEGDTVTITAYPEPGNRFAGWAGDASGTAPSISFIMIADMNIVAVFEAIPVARAALVPFGVAAGIGMVITAIIMKRRKK